MSDVPSVSQAAFSIRPASEEDLPGLAALDASVQRAPWTEAQWGEELRKPYARVWLMTDDETDSKIAGVISFWLFMGDCHIQSVATALEFRGLGYAQKLIRAAVNEAMRGGGGQEPVKRAILEVRRSNTPAIQLYQKLGFTITAVRKRFYSDGEDAFQMELGLEGQRVFPEF